MAHAAKSTDFGDIHDLSTLLRIIDEVSATGEPCVLKRGKQEIAQIAPVKAEARRRRKGRGLTLDDPLFSIIGLGRSDEPTDVAENKHKYLAEAYEDDHS